MLKSFHYNENGTLKIGVNRGIVNTRLRYTTSGRYFTSRLLQLRGFPARPAGFVSYRAYLHCFPGNERIMGAK